MRVVLAALLLVGCSSSKRDESASGSATTGSSANSGSAAAPTPSGIAVDDPRLIGALEGCGAIQIEYGPYQRPPGGGISPDAKRCAAVLVDEAYRHAAIAAMDTKCAADNARACYVAGALRTEVVTSVGLAAATAGDAKPRFVVRKFSPHNVDAKPRFVTPEEKAEATRLFGRACELGDVDGCARPLFDRANAGADATEIIAFACKHGSDHACQLQTAK